MANEDHETSGRHLAMAHWWREGLTDEEIAKRLRISAEKLSDEWTALKRSLGAVSKAVAVELVVARIIVDARKALKEERAELALVLKSDSDTAVLSLNSQGVITNVCRHSAELLGAPREAIFGQTVDVLLAGKLAQVEQSTAEMASSEESGPVSSERTHQRQDGSEFQAEHRVVAIIGALGGTTGFVRTIRDLTGQHVLELHIEELELSIALMVEGLEPV